MNLPMLKNSDNKTSASFTMAFLSFNLVSLWLLLYIICPLFKVTTIPEFNGSSSMLYLTPILAIYFGRRYSEGKEKSEVKE